MQKLADRKSSLEKELTGLEEKARFTAAAYQEEAALWNAFQARCRHQEEQMRLLDEEVLFLENQSRQLLEEITRSKEEIAVSQKSLQEFKDQEISVRAEEQTAVEKLNAFKAEALAQRRQENLLQDALRQWENQ